MIHICAGIVVYVALLRFTSVRLLSTEVVRYHTRHSISVHGRILYRWRELMRGKRRQGTSLLEERHGAIVDEGFLYLFELGEPVNLTYIKADVPFRRLLQ